MTIVQKNEIINTNNKVYVVMTSTFVLKRKNNRKVYFKEKVNKET